MNLKSQTLLISGTLFCFVLTTSHKAAGLDESFPRSNSQKAYLLDNEGTSQEIVDEAWDLIVEGELQKAEKLLLEVLKTYPDSLYSHMVLGNLYLEQEKLKAAERQFMRVLRESEMLPDTQRSDLNSKAVSWAYMGIGELFKRWRRYAQAEVAFMKAMNAFTNPLAYCHLGILARTYRKDLALSELIHKEVLNFDPDFVGNKIYLAVTYWHEGKIEKANQLIQKLGKKERSTHLLELTIFYSVSGEAHKAFRYFKKIFNRVNISPDHRRRLLERVQEDEDFKTLREFQPYQDFVQGRKEGRWQLPNSQSLRR